MGNKKKTAQSAKIYFPGFDRSFVFNVPTFLFVHSTVRLLSYLTGTQGKITVCHFLTYFYLIVVPASLQLVEKLGFY